MSHYKITEYSYKQAQKLNVKIKPSTNPSKKLDVFKNGEKVASIGAIGYNDYPTWIKKEGVEYAKKRRSLYKARHESDRHVKNSAGFYSDKILW